MAWSVQCLEGFLAFDDRRRCTLMLTALQNVCTQIRILFENKCTIFRVSFRFYRLLASVSFRFVRVLLIRLEDCAVVIDRQIYIRQVHTGTQTSTQASMAVCIGFWFTFTISQCCAERMTCDIKFYCAHVRAVHESARPFLFTFIRVSFLRLQSCVLCF